MEGNCHPGDEIKVLSAGRRHGCCYAAVYFGNLKKIVTVLPVIDFSGEVELLVMYMIKRDVRVVRVRSRTYVIVVTECFLNTQASSY